MSIRFTADGHELLNEDGLMVVGFADNRLDPGNFLLLQRADEFDEQDEQLAMDTYHVELGDPGLAGYGGIEHVLLGRQGLVFTFSSSVSWCANLGSVEVLGISDVQALASLEVALGTLFAGTATTMSKN